MISLLTQQTYWPLHGARSWSCTDDKTRIRLTALCYVGGDKWNILITMRVYWSWLCSWSLNNAGVRGSAPPPSPKSKIMLTYDSPKMYSLLLTWSLMDNINSRLAPILCRYYVLQFYNKVSERKENVFWIVLQMSPKSFTIFYWKKSICKWTFLVQTCVVQGAIVVEYAVLEMWTDCCGSR